MMEIINLINMSSPGIESPLPSFAPRNLFSLSHPVPVPRLTRAPADDTLDPQSRAQYHFSKDPSKKETPPVYFVRVGATSSFSIVRRALLYIDRALDNEQAQQVGRIAEHAYTVLKVLQMFLLPRPMSSPPPLPQSMHDFLSDPAQMATASLLKASGLKELIEDDIPCDGKNSAGVRVVATLRCHLVLTQRVISKLKNLLQIAQLASIPSNTSDSLLKCIEEIKRNLESCPATNLDKIRSTIKQLRLPEWLVQGPLGCSDPFLRPFLFDPHPLIFGLHSFENLVHVALALQTIMFNTFICVPRNTSDCGDYALEQLYALVLHAYKEVFMFMLGMDSTDNILDGLKDHAEILEKELIGAGSMEVSCFSQSTSKSFPFDEGSVPRTLTVFLSHFSKQVNWAGVTREFQKVRHLWAERVTIMADNIERINGSNVLKGGNFVTVLIALCSMIGYLPYHMNKSCNKNGTRNLILECYTLTIACTGMFSEQAAEAPSDTVTYIPLRRFGGKRATKLDDFYAHPQTAPHHMLSLLPLTGWVETLDKDGSGNQQMGSGEVVRCIPNSRKRGHEGYLKKKSNQEKTKAKSQHCSLHLPWIQAFEKMQLFKPAKDANSGM